MARAVDEQRRADLIAKCLPYFAAHGVAGLSLRPLAAALGTSDRMLIHYFGTKEALVGRVLAESRPDVPALIAVHGDDVAALAAQVWDDLTRGGGQEVRVRLLLEIMALALTQPDPYASYARAAVHDWIEPIAAALRNADRHSADDAHARASALVSGLRGLALDRFITGDVHRTDAAAQMLIDAATTSRTT